MSEKEIDSCVKFSRNSWHRKLYKKVYGRHSLQTYDFELHHDEKGDPYHKKIWNDRIINLCPYMRRIVWACVLFPFLSIWRKLPESWQYREDEAKVIVIFAILCTFAHFIINVSYDVWYAGLLGFFGGIGIVLVIFGVWLLAGVIVEKLESKRSIGFPDTGLLTSYIHAKHEKICPCIEFVGEEKDDD